MKKKLIIFCFVAVAAVSAGLYVQSPSGVDNDLLMTNVQALAEDESWWDSKTHACVVVDCLLYDDFWDTYSSGTKERCQDGNSYAHCWDCNTTCR